MLRLAFKPAVSCPCSTSLFDSYLSRSLATNSRRAPTADGASTSEAQPRIPRYLRRRAQFGPGPREYEGKSSQRATSAEVKIGRNGEPMKLLEPHVLSSRLKKLCERGKVDDAIAMLKNSPLDAQNAPVWNTLIWECMKASRYKTAQLLFTDMKRRGFSPTTRTYQTMFTGLSRIEDWYKHTKQLEHAHKLYEYFHKHLQSLKKDDPKSPELDITPLANYIKILGDAGEHQKIFEVYYELDSYGPLSANQFIYTSMFLAISKFKNTTRKVTMTSANPSEGVADAKLLWKQAVKASERPGGFAIDAILVSAAISALSSGRQSEQALAFQLVGQYFGLTKPGDAITVGKFPLTPPALTAALMLCNAAHKPSLCLHYFQQLSSPRSKLKGVELLDRGHMEEVLKAHVALSAMRVSGQPSEALATLEWMLKQEISSPNGPRIRPGKTTFDLVLMACWRGADWHSASRTFELMTGLRSNDFLDEKYAQKPRMEKRSVGRNLVPDAETMSSLLRAAYASRDRVNAAQCLRMVEHVGPQQLFTQASGTRRKVKHEEFYQAKLAAALVDTVNVIFDKRAKDAGQSKPFISHEEKARWTDLKKLAQKTSQRIGIQHNMAPPLLEQDIKPTTGSDSFIEYEVVPQSRASFLM